MSSLLIKTRSLGFSKTCGLRSACGHCDTSTESCSMRSARFFPFLHAALAGGYPEPFIVMNPLKMPAKLITLVVDKAVSLLLLHIYGALQAEAAREVARDQVALTQEAAEAERNGCYHAAVTLRAAAERHGSLAGGLDALDMELARLLKPTPLVLQRAEPEPVEMPGAVTPALPAGGEEPARRGPGRPRKTQDMPSAPPSATP